MTPVQQIETPADDEIPLSEAAKRFNISYATLVGRTQTKVNPLPSTLKQVKGRKIRFVRVSDMANQQPVNKAKNPTNKLAKKGKKSDAKSLQHSEAQAREITGPEQILNEKDQELERYICHAFGRVQRELEIYAESRGIAPSVLTFRVGELLQLSESRRELGSVNRMPNM